MTRRITNDWFPYALALLVVASLALTGCSRAAYRKWADRDAACLLESRQFDDRWDIPERAVEPHPTSRMADLNDPDCGPLPPDDPAAHRYMNKPYNSKRRVEYWDRRGTGATIDAEQWLQYLPYNEDGEVVLTKELAIDLALLHSREFQTQVEQLYLEALSLAQSRFAFNIQWAGGSGGTFNLDGAEGAPRTLFNSSNLSASRSFASGGQFVVDLVNSVTYQFGGGQSNFATGNLLFQLTQPLLRNAFRHVQTEGLTQAERNLLYSVRDFARFRRSFYLTIVQQYLSLLSQSQQIRIEEENITSLDQNLEFHEYLYLQGTIAQIQIDQIFQDKQNGRISLIQAQQAFQNAKDQFKFELGLPAKVRIKLDESILDPFKLNSDDVVELQTEIDALARQLTQYLPPKEMPESFSEESYAKLKKLQATAASLRPTVEEEIKRWKAQIKSKSEQANTDKDQQLELEFQVSLSDRIERTVTRLEDDLEKTRERIEAGEAGKPDPFSKSEEVETPYPEFSPSDKEAPTSPNQAETVEQLSKLDYGAKKTPGVKSFDRLERAISSLIADINNLFVAQTQIRLFLIDITPVEIDEATAVELALRNRLDLMNAKGFVVDSYRGVEIAADQLESDLNFTASANLQPDPTRDNGIRFDGESATYSAGLQFDGPLNRFAERNSFRAAQIGYQQQRRSYMAAEDSIVNEIRADLRGLTQSRFNFQTTRQQLIAAARQVDQSRERVKDAQGGSDSSVTQDLLNSLAGLRNAQNGLISNWFNYEVARIGLFIDLELLLLDERGRWINEDEQLRYNQESIDQLLPQAEEIGAGQEADSDNASTEESDKAAEVDAAEPSDGEIDLNSDSIDTPQPDTTIPELPELDPLDYGKVKGNESPQNTTQPFGSERASRTTSNRRYSAGRNLRR